ncbi:hypothetical protein pb186bvf_010317 [Paramecium bursaria]
MSFIKILRIFFMEDNNQQQYDGLLLNVFDESHIPFEYYSNQFQQNEYHPHTQNTPNQQPLPTRTQAFLTVAETKYDPKNIPKTIGNYIRRKVQEVEKQGPQFDSKIPIKLKIFKDKKTKGKQADYKLEDFRDMLSDEPSAKFCRQFFENQIFLEFLYSNRIPDPMTQVAFIEQYLRGTLNPQFFKSNRTKEHLKIPQKQKNI